MFLKIVGGKVLTPSGTVNASVIVKDGVIEEITESPVDIPDAKVYDAKGLHVVPGGIDIHIHGGGGREFEEATEDAFRAVMTSHARYGTTSFLPTLPACPFETIRKSVSICEKLISEPDSPLLGLHLEGPYLNPRKVGAIIPEYVTPPVEGDYKSILESTKVIKRWDYAPELPGTEAFALCLQKHSVLASLAHTVAEYPQVLNAYNRGCTHATHFYNAMTSVHNVREYKHEGTVESVYLIPGMTVEVIADGKHVPPAILRLIYQIKGADRTALITDALAASAGGDVNGISDGRVIVEDGVCKLSDRSALAGSIATMDVLIRTMVGAGIPFDDAIRMSSETPARIIGVQDRKGTLQKGKDADIVIYDNDINVKLVLRKGNQITGSFQGSR
ncbi:MAG: N-acetylglucosamine-6-phosphate deacetylase [Bacteroidales bacterium]|nr:N-acetylglucosamine-6-phosphate deacetylase [Bacteroidales bacterium]